MLGDSSTSGKAETPCDPRDPVSFSASDFAEKLETLESQFASLREQVAALQKYAAIGTMTATVAHELNNLLTPLLSYSQYVLTKDDPSLWQKALERNVRRGEQMRRLCNNILASGGNRERCIEDVVVLPIVEELLDISGRAWKKDNIKTYLEIPPELAVRADSGQLQQVLLNLLINARHALHPQGGTLRVSAQPQQNRIAIAVSDNGPGIAPDVLSRIFEPFFTTKVDGDANTTKGAGLGLHVSRDLVAGMNGELTVESTLGQGATFTIMLPPADTQPPNE